MKIISVIGCGTMGNGIAQTFALFDFNVKLYDISLSNLDNAKKTILRNLERMVKKEVISHSELEKTSEIKNTRRKIARLKTKMSNGGEKNAHRLLFLK